MRRRSGRVASPSTRRRFPTSRRSGASSAGRASRRAGTRSCPSWKPARRSRRATPPQAAINAIADACRGCSAATPTSPCRRRRAIKDGGDFDGTTGDGRNIHYGVREHAMGAIANGMAYHGGVRPFVATFFCFSDYMRPAVRLAALNELPVHLRLDARLDRARRGRPDAPAGRAPDVAAGDARI